VQLEARLIKVVARVTEIMQLRPWPSHDPQVIVSVQAEGAQRSGLQVAAHGSVAICPVRASSDADMVAVQLVRVGSLLVRQAECRGGLLVHGALVARDRFGVILAGPGGMGKTTACRRLQPPWRSLCDDATLVVRDQGGTYWGHPWPTWSNFLWGGPGGSWDVQNAVPLRAIFFLAQAQKDQAEPVETAQAVCLLLKSAEQTLSPMMRGLGEDEIRAHRLLRFDSICALARAVPCYHLRLSHDGAFWQQMDCAIAES
jgi:SynChlorMet cassette protein ScmC